MTAEHASAAASVAPPGRDVQPTQPTCATDGSRGESDSVTWHLTISRRRLRLVVPVALAAIVAVVLILMNGGSGAPRQAAASQPASQCFVTGGGNQLCGAAAAAYCNLHYGDYLNKDHASAQQCDAAFPGLHCAAVAQYNAFINSTTATSLPGTVDKMRSWGYDMTPYSEPGC